MKTKCQMTAYLHTHLAKRSLRFACLMLFSLLCFPASAQYKINVTKFNETIYIYESYANYQGNKIGANAVVFAGQDSVVIIDTPWGEDQTQQLLDWVATELKKPVAYFIITHAHEDRIGGIRLLKDKEIATVSSALTAEEATKRGYPAPDKLFKSDSTFRIDETEIEVFYPGAGHTIDNVVVYFPRERVLYGGCFLKSSEASNLGNLEDADVTAWPESLKKVERRFPRPKLVIPGHGTWQPGAIETTARLLNEH